MADKKDKSWWGSENRWAYFKVGLIYFTSPQKVYEIAHKRSSSNIRERLIRLRLLEMGILRNQSAPSEHDEIDLVNGHI